MTLELKYDSKNGFEPYWSLDAKYDGISMIPNLLYDIESKTLMVLCSVVSSMWSMIVL